MRNLILFTICFLSYTTTLYAQNTLPLWQNPHAISEGTIEPHSQIIPTANNEQITNIKSSPFYLSLNGNWKFSWMQNPTYRPREFYDPHVDLSTWDNIKVPGNWEIQGYGNSTNINNQFNTENTTPPYVSNEKNEVGSYRRDFTIPENWDDTKRIVLAFDGVSSFFYVWLNGEFLGYNQGSKTEAEWDVTDKIKKGQTNTVAVEAYSWSSLSHLEYQSYWSLSGIERDVYLYATPKTFIADYTTESSVDKESYSIGNFSLSVELKGANSALKNVNYELSDTSGTIVLKDTKQTDNNGIIKFSNEKINNVNLWSAEQPYLYSLKIDLGDNEQTIISNVGFRTIEHIDGKLLVNGQPIKIKGVSRIEHSSLGSYVSEKLMLNEIRLMKRNNINAVKNANYPNSKEWYELCDKYGLYVLDEVNIEHSNETFANDPAWLDAHTHKTKTMYERSKNHPSIIAWSLGSSTKSGVNLDKVYEWLKERENSRIIQYSANSNLSAYCSEFEVKDYWDISCTHDNAQGGFISNWISQSFKAKDKGGKELWNYSANNFEASKSSALNNTCAHGLINADRLETPLLAEVKAIYQNIKTTVKEVTGDYVAIDINNRFYFTSTNEYTLKWEYVSNVGDVLQSGETTVDLAPNSSKTINLEGLQANGTEGEIFLNFKWYPKENKELINKSHLVAVDQYIHYVEKTSIQEPIKTSEKKLEYDPETGVLSNKLTDITISKKTGAITSLRRERNEFLQAPLTLSFYRPATSNDFLNNNLSLWKEIGLDSTYQKLNNITVSYDKKITTLNTEVTIYSRTGEGLFNANMQYVFTYNGCFDVEVELTPINDKIKTVARIGWTLEMSKSFENVRYLGRSEESYPDRKRAGYITNVRTNINNMFYNYIIPQTSGDRADTRYVAISNAYDNAGLLIKAEQPFSFSYVPYDDNIIDKATHINELHDTKTNTLHIDYEIQGIGKPNDNNGGNLIKIEPKKFKFSFIPFIGMETFKEISK
ncbi:MAG: glycoside hydrolase family 2 TIM barrel-domain containing protein [Rikenellaceae bacterium]